LAKPALAKPDRKRKKTPGSPSGFTRCFPEGKSSIAHADGDGLLPANHSFLVRKVVEGNSFPAKKQVFLHRWQK